mmetsp:Transcript_20077/g.50933  ORF Transcript_20077/g.50933 Transcript_20077/m.50933 type:complete len:136 (-) Transcript_20077:2-409(-)
MHSSTYHAQPRTHWLACHTTGQSSSAKPLLGLPSACPRPLAGLACSSPASSTGIPTSLIAATLPVGPPPTMMTAYCSASDIACLQVKEKKGEACSSLQKKQAASVDEDQDTQAEQRRAALSASALPCWSSRAATP